MAFNWDVLAQNLPQLASVVGGIAGANSGGGTPAARAGAMAGMGDAMHEQNTRKYQQDIEYRKSIGDQFEKIGMDESWPGPARELAWQNRLQVLNPSFKLKQPLIDKMFSDVHMASARPADGAAERNTARTSIPALQQQSTDATSAAQNVDSNMQQMQQLPSQVGLDFLGPGAQSTFNTMKQSAPGLYQDAQSANTKLQSAQTSLQGYSPNAEPTTMYGPKTKAEQSREMMDVRRQEMQQQMEVLQRMNTGAGGGAGTGAGGALGGGGHFVPGFSATGQMVPHYVSDQFGALMLHMGDGSWVPGSYNSKTGGYTLQNGQPATDVKGYMRRGDTLKEITTPGADGAPEQKAISLTDQANSGKTYAKYQRPTTKLVMQEDGTSLLTVIAPDGSVMHTQPVGAKFGAALDLKLKGLGIEGKELGNIKTAIHIQGWARLPNGSVFTPNGISTNENGPIPASAGPRALPTPGQLGKASAANDLYNTIETMKPLAEQLEQRFGPIKGKLEDWALSHGWVLNNDPEGARLVGEWLAARKSLGGFGAQTHAFRNTIYADQIEDMIGAFGQDFSLDKGKLDGLQGMALRVLSSNTKSMVPSAKSTSQGVQGVQRNGKARPAPGAAPPPPPPPPTGAKDADYFRNKWKLK